MELTNATTHPFATSYIIITHFGKRSPDRLPLGNFTKDSLEIHKYCSISIVHISIAFQLIQ